jgi:hypothetical protein
MNSKKTWKKNFRWLAAVDGGGGLGLESGGRLGPAAGPSRRDGWLGEGWLDGVDGRLQSDVWRRVVATWWVNFFMWIQVWSSSAAAWEGKRVSRV